VVPSGEANTILPTLCPAQEPPQVLEGARIYTVAVSEHPFESLDAAIAEAAGTASTSTESYDPVIYDPASPSATKEALGLLGHAPNRTLGQNFLVNRGARDRICDIAVLERADSVLEIGPGLGSLTCELLRRAGRVAAIEKDPSFEELLRHRLPSPRLRLVPGDALKVTWEELQLPGQNVKVVANLPYSVSKPLLRRLIEEWRGHFSSLTVMVQREVADRLTASPDTSAYGPMAIMAALHTHAKREFDLSPGSFLPPPSVTSSVVHLRVRETPALELRDENFFWRVVNAAFAQRRKQLGNTLRAIHPDREALRQTLESCGIDPQRRGETLSLPEFASLAHALQSPR
jgi:16S rRNA (adenine1518-N6/adenine1519-N6)-dimethyltransferase